MTAEEIINQLKQMGNEQTKKVLMRHGAREPFFGVQVADLKKIQKKIKKDYPLSLDLYKTGISDAMYLAGLIADEEKMTRDDLQQWAEQAYWYMLSEYTVAWVASESRFGPELALKWIESDRENIASSGWATLASLLALQGNQDLDSGLLHRLLNRVSQSIHQSPNRVRYAMNGFVIAAGIHLPGLTGTVLEVAGRIGKVHVDMGGTACKVPLATDYIKKVLGKGKPPVKKKSARC